MSPTRTRQFTLILLCLFLVQCERDFSVPPVEEPVAVEPEKSAEATPVRDADLYNECKEDKRAPWCYEEKVVAMKKPELCANITKHWGDGAGGVEGYCYFEIAKKTKDCSLCKKIKNSQVRNNLCMREVCRK